jgi:hypothetical protein
MKRKSNIVGPKVRKLRYQRDLPPHTATVSAAKIFSSASRAFASVSGKISVTSVVCRR